MRLFFINIQRSLRQKIQKAGSILNLYRWLSARTMKETFNPPTDYRYPFAGEIVKLPRENTVKF